MSVAGTIVPPAAEPEEARSISIERTLAAPRDLVFETFSDAQHLSRWWGPDGFSLTTSVFDFRPGGVWRFVMHGPDGRDYQNRIVFEAIERPSLLKLRHGGADEGDPVHFVATLSFETAGEATRLSWRMVFPSIAERDRVDREYGAVKGLEETTGRLVEYVSALAKG